MHILDTQPHRISPAAQLHSPPNTRPRSMDQHYPHPCFVLLAHSPGAAYHDACDATMCSTQHCLSHALCTFWTPKTIPKPRNTAPFTSQRPSAKLDQHYPHPCFVLLVHCPRAACTDACGATMCSTQPCLPRAFCTFWTPKTIPQPRNTAPFTSPRASAKHGAALPPPCFVLLLHCPRAACTDACGATMCSTQPCLPRAFCTFWTPKTIPQPRNTAPFTSPHASAKHGAALPPPMLRSTFALPQSSLQ